MEKYDWIRVSELIFLKRTGAITRSQQEELDGWLSADDRHRRLYERALGGKSFEKSLRIIKTLDISAAKNKIASGIKLRLRRRHTLWIGSAAAAAIAAVALVFFMGPDRDTYPASIRETVANDITLSVGDNRQIVLNSQGEADEWMGYAEKELTAGVEQTDEIVTMRVTVPRGREYRLLLPDGSYVWLNSESEIEYPSSFSEVKRQVSLTGEAYFDITADPSHPFEITTHGKLRITVLGTQFNINSYADVNETFVTLVAGSVLVAHDGGEVVLNPDQQAVFNRESNILYARDVADASIYSAWINGMFDFENEPFDVILQAIGKWYGIRFEAGEIDLNSLGHFTLSAPRGLDLSQTAGILRKITGLEYVIRNGVVYISEK